MQISFDQPADFSSSIRQSLSEMARRTFAICKQQFSSADDHIIPHCRFCLGHQEANTGNLAGIQISFSDAKSLLDQITTTPEKIERLIHHEMVHFFQSHLVGTEPFNYLPTWFHEGMAVAFSGQELIARKSHLDEDMENLGGSGAWDLFYLMDEYLGINCTEFPFDGLYGSWGALFIYTVTEQTSIFPNHALYGADSYLHSRVSATECDKALAIMRTAFDKGFDAALAQHTDKMPISEDDFRQFLASD